VTIEQESFSLGCKFHCFGFYGQFGRIWPIFDDLSMEPFRCFRFHRLFSKHGFQAKRVTMFVFESKYVFSWVQLFREFSRRQGEGILDDNSPHRWCFQFSPNDLGLQLFCPKFGTIVWILIDHLACYLKVGNSNWEVKPYYNFWLRKEWKELIVWLGDYNDIFEAI